jgi:RNA polymerase sigma-70 factor (ECF subfamily)
MDAFLDAARGAWPELEVPAEEFARYVADRPSAALAHAADLYLACACARGVPGAAEAFDSEYGGVIERVLARRRASWDLADDAAQTLRERLLVGDAPKIAEYSGRGPLRSWVASAAATTVLMMRRAAGRRREDAEDEIAEIAAGEPDLAYMKQRYKAELEDAIAKGIARLGDRDRALLKLHLGERLGIDRIGAMYKVDRSTAARWLAAARGALVSAAREEARARLKLDDAECDSIAELVRSELHVSIARLLG